MKSIALQTVEELGGPRSVLWRQRREHVELGGLLRQLASFTPERSGTLLVRIYRLAFPHAFAEEAVLFPSSGGCCPTGMS